MTTHSKRGVLLAAFGNGAWTALGTDWETSWAGLKAGCRRFERVDRDLPGWPDDSPTATLKDWPWGFDLIGRARSLACVLGQRIKSLCEELTAANPGLRPAVILSTSHGESYAVSEFSERVLKSDRQLGPAASEAILCEGLLPAFLDGAGVRWPGETVSAACASACVAAGLAAARIAHGVCDACFVVSLDVLSRVAQAGFRQIGAMSRDGCRPFDRRRDGITIGEAGSVILLAARKTALPSSVRWVVRMEGFGQFCDARHPVEPSAGGICEALGRALADAGCKASDLAAIYWHGTGTIQNDRTEAAAAGNLFSDRVPPGTATKGAFGHAMGASAALSILSAGETLHSRILPPVAGLEDPEFPQLNLVRGEPLRVDSGPVAVVALGFGGINAALVLNCVPFRENHT